MFNRYLVSITQVVKVTQFGLDNWYERGNLFTICIPNEHCIIDRMHAISRRVLCQCP
jgi:hypothetical protein